MKYTFYDEEYDLCFIITQYADNGTLAVEAYDPKEGPFATVTVNLPESDELESDQQYLDMNNSQNLVLAMAKEGYIVLTNKVAFSGFCAYPMGVFTEKFFKEAKEG